MTQGVELPTYSWVIGAANPSALMLGGGDFGDGFIYLSTDGINWAGVANIGYPGAADACGWGTNFVIVGYGGATWAAATYTADNWDTWHDGDLEIGVGWEGVACKPDGSVVVAVGAKDGNGVVSRSLDGGATWSPATDVFGAGNFPGKIGWNGTVFIAVTYSGQIWTSPDGGSWTERLNIPGASIWDVIGRLSDGLAVAVGYDDLGATGIWYSSDGLTWTQASPPAGFTGQIVRVAANAAVFVVIEDGGTDYSTSPDGAAWSVPVPTPDNTFGDSFYDDAELSRDDLCMRATKFSNYAVLFTGEVAAPVTGAFFHFTFGG